MLPGIVGKMARPYRHITPTRKRTRRQSFRVPSFGIQPSIDRPHGKEALDAPQEDVDFCEDGETTIAHDGAIAIPVETVEENDVPQILLQARPSFSTSWVRGCPRGGQRCTEGPRFLRSETAYTVRKIPQTRTWGSRVCRREPRTTQRRQVRSTCREARGQFKRVHRCSRAHGTETVLSWSFLDVRRSRPWRGPVGYWRSKGTRRGTATERVVLVACGIRSPGRLEPGAARIRKRYRRRDEANRC